MSPDSPTRPRPEKRLPRLAGLRGGRGGRDHPNAAAALGAPAPSGATRKRLILQRARSAYSF